MIQREHHSRLIFARITTKVDLLTNFCSGSVSPPDSDHCRHCWCEECFSWYHFDFIPHKTTTIKINFLVDPQESLLQLPRGGNLHGSGMPPSRHLGRLFASEVGSTTAPRNLQGTKKPWSEMLDWTTSKSGHLCPLPELLTRASCKKRQEEVFLWFVPPTF